MTFAASVAIALAAAIAIYGASVVFVNAIEWVGRRLRLGETATGAILAALGTALPETMITLVAVLTGGGRTGDIGIGTALGGPLALSTAGYGIFALTKRRSGQTNGGGFSTSDRSRLVSDQMWFLAMFGVQLLLGLVFFPGKRWTAIGFLIAYGVYVWRTTRSGSAAPAKAPPALFLAPGSRSPSLVIALVQTGGALAVLAFASHFFVGELERLGTALSLDQQATGLLLSPLATELPEVLNTILWVRRGKAKMALANISGAMLVQTAMPAALGLGFTSWRLTLGPILAGIVTMTATLLVLAVIRRGGLAPPISSTARSE